MHAAGGLAGGSVDTIIAVTIVVAARCCLLWKKLHFVFSRNAILAGTRSVQLVTASPIKPEHLIFGKSVLHYIAMDGLVSVSIGSIFTRGEERVLSVAQTKV